MENFLPGFIMGFREGLEAFLVVAIIIQYLGKVGMKKLRVNAFYGVISGIAGSLAFGGLLYLISNAIGKTEELSKIWESLSSLIALGLVSTFIYWMIKNGSQMADHVKNQIGANLSSIGVFTVTLMMVMREGIEVAIFTFAGKYQLLSILVGISLSLIFTILIFFSLVKINIKTIFQITLAYLILQAGFLLGYSIHEGLSAMKSLGMLSGAGFLFKKAFDLSKTILYHKEGIIGLPLYVFLGWYSKPELLQFIAQYTYTFSMFFFWFKSSKKIKIKDR